MSFRATPATILSGLALFFALGGSALAVSHAVKPQPRCANGAVRGIASVTGDPSKGVANMPDVLELEDVVLADVQLRRRRGSGAARGRWRLRRSLRRQRRPECSRQRDERA